MRTGAGDVTSISNPFFPWRFQYTSTIPPGIGTRPVAHINSPTFGATNTFLYPGSNGLTPSTHCVKNTTGAADHPWQCDRVSRSLFG